MSVLDQLNGATAAVTSVPIVLDAALQARHDELTRQLDHAARDDARDGTLADAAPNTNRLLEQLDAIEAKMAASRVVFEVTQIHWGERIRLQAQHPPRIDNPIDLRNGFNVETYFPALIRHCVVSVTDAAGDTVRDIPEATWEHLLGVSGTVARPADEERGVPAVDAVPARPGALNFNAVNRLVAAAKLVNDEPTVVPTSARSYLGTLPSGASLAQPAPGASPRDAGEAGSPSGSPKLSATKKGRSKAGSDGS